MKVTVLAENTACREDVIPQHGLSLFLETEHQKILMDMGQDDTFLHNGKALGADLSQVDIAIISHGHYDHGGGLETFLRINQKAPVYIHEKAFGSYYNGTEKYIGLDISIQYNPRLIFTKGTCNLAPNLDLEDCNDLDWTHNSWGLNCKEENTLFPDSFLHEQYLLIREGEKRILISGCSHKGIVNIAEYFRPHVLIGGFHLSKETNAQHLRKIGESLLNINTVYYTGHCTGAAQYEILKEAMGEHLQSLSTGLIFEV